MNSYSPHFPHNRRLRAWLAALFFACSFGHIALMAIPAHADGAAAEWYDLRIDEDGAKKATQGMVFNYKAAAGIVLVVTAIVLIVCYATGVPHIWRTAAIVNVLVLVALPFIRWMAVRAGLDVSWFQ
jgi:hypothetical protein